MSGNNWDSHRLHITETLERLEEQTNRIEAKLNKIETDLEVHKVKSGLWGASMGALVAFVSKFFLAGGGGSH